MKNIRSYVCALFLAGFYAADAGALVYSNPSSWYADLIGKSQNQIFESKPLSLPEARNISPLPKYAKVHFIVDTNDKLGFDNIEQSFDHDNVNRCKTLGFNKTGACGANERVSRYCPYDNSYYDQCCDLNFGYAKAECSYPNTISGNSCGGKFKCYCDRSIYPYTATSCPSPKIHNEDKCAEVTYSAGKATTSVYYSDCLCPSTWITCDSSIHQKGNGTACEYNGVTTYASCTCEAGYSLLCDEFGPQSPMDYCFLKGTKYYKTCKTEKDVCESLGYKYSKDEPCDADSVIASYCPRGSGNTYFSCKIDPDKYCKNRGYTQTSCGAYETESSSKCNVPGYGVQESYRKCNATCKSRLANAGYKEINEGLWYKGTTAVVFKSLTLNDALMKNPLGTYYSSWRGEASFYKYDGYKECSSYNRPNLTFTPDLWLFNNNLDNLWITINHNNNPNEAHTSSEGNYIWRDIYVTSINNAPSVSSKNFVWREYIPFGTLRIHINGQIDLHGSNTFSSDGYYNLDANHHGRANNHDVALHFFELGGSGKLVMDGSQNYFNNVPILLYQCSGDCSVILRNKAYMSMPHNGIAINGGNGKFSMDNSSADIYALRISGCGGACQNMSVTNNSTLNLDTWLRLYNARLDLKSNSKVTTQDNTIEVCNKDKICLGSGATLRSGGGAYSVSGPAGYYATPGKGDCDNGVAGQDGYNGWYKKTYNEIVDRCGYYGG